MKKQPDLRAVWGNSLKDGMILVLFVYLGIANYKRNMKLSRLLTFLFLIATLEAGAQCMAPFWDLTKQFYVYDNSEKKYIEPLAPASVKTGRNYVAFINNESSRLRLYYAGKTYTVCENNADYYATDNWFVWKNFGLLGVLYKNELKTLDKLALTEYWVGDSIISWVTNFNELKVFYSGESQVIEALPIQQKTDAAGNVTSNLKMGDNIMAYVDGSNQFKVFYNGTVVTLESYEPSMYMVDRDLVVYLDNTNNFKFFSKGKSYETSINSINRYWTGEGYFVYYTLGRQLAVWYEGEEQTLAQDRPKELLIQQNMIAFTDKSDNFYVWYKGKTELLERFHPLSVKAYRDVVVYQDLDGRLKGYLFGKPVQVSDQIVNGYELYNETVAYSLQPGDHTFWCRGQSTTITE